MIKSDRTIKGLGEASIRVKDLRAMQKFYQDVVGLDVLRQEEDYVFFTRLDTCPLALLRRS